MLPFPAAMGSRASHSPPSPQWTQYLVSIPWLGYDIVCFAASLLLLWQACPVRLASALRGPLAGAEAGRGCAGEQPSGIASGVSTDDGVLRGRTPRSAVRISAGACLQMENHRTVAELSFWARADWLVGLRLELKKLRFQEEMQPCPASTHATSTRALHSDSRRRTHRPSVPHRVARSRSSRHGPSRRGSSVRGMTAFVATPPPLLTSPAVSNS